MSLITECGLLDNHTVKTRKPSLNPQKLTWWKRLFEEQKVLVRFQPEGPGRTREGLPGPASTSNES